jgi:glycosyltransferase involved in cell wall biosynthesis
MPTPPPEHYVIVVMPAYNAARTLERTVGELPRGHYHEVILVDDASHDDTVRIARDLGLKVIQHDRNRGYGANQKTCYAEALRAGADIVVMVHPDYQYDPTLLPDIIAPLKEGRADVVFGSRLLAQSAWRQGMPWWKYLANRALTWLENHAFHLHLSEFHTGYRAYTADALRRVDFAANADDFVFDQDIVAQFVAAGARFAEIPVPVRYFPEASSASLRASVVYGLKILRLLGRWTLHRTGLHREPAFVPRGPRPA